MSEKIQNEDGELFRTSADQAYQVISQRILDGEYAPGMRLSRRKMAQACNVSVIPVIEALKRLENDNLVESKPQWGSFVSIPTLDKVKKMYAFREAIECQTARIMAVQITPTQIKALSETAQVLDNTAYTAETTAMMQETHFAFHCNLCEYTENPMLVEALRKINLFWILCKALREKRPNTPVPRYWHQKLVDEIATGDPDRAERMMREHVLDSLTPIISNWADLA